ncbi:MAG: biopolymer transporter ExbD [Acidobacteria bacterium]|nr:biopolymer transporter ExbD [Acidobacteriota bacterium]
MPTVRTGGDQSRSGARRRGRRPVATSLSEINVVPLVDVMLVMLVIFMVTAPMMQRGLPVNLPESRRAEPLAAEQLFVTVPLAYRSEGVVQVGDDRVPVEALAERLRADLADRTEKSVFLRGDGAITYAELVQVVDVIKEGGVQELGLVLAEPTGR